MSRSELTYGVLLLAYPREFRRRYGDEMVQVFGDSCRDAERRGGTLGMMLWVRTVSDLTSVAIVERICAVRSRWLFVLIPLVLALGFAIAYVDSSPGWDDTGISAAAVLGVSGLSGSLYPARPWLWGLAVGAWIPVFGVITESNYPSLLALVFSFAGAYAGAAVRGKLFPAER